MTGCPSDLARYAAAGMSQVEAARAMGIAPQAVSRYAKKFGLTFAHKPYRAEAWRQCAQQGMTAAEAAKARGKTTHAAYMAARTHGIAFRPAAGRTRQLPEFNERDRRTYCKLRDAKVPREEALRVLGYGASDA